MSNFRDLLEYVQAVAIAEKVHPTDEGLWRYICRNYSKKFNTPLHEVIKMDPEFVMLHYYEDQVDAIDTEDDLERILDIIYTLEDPEYERQKEKDVEDFIKESEEQEEERIKAGKPIHPAMKNDSIEKALLGKETKVEEKQPLGGQIDLSYLEEEEMQQEIIEEQEEE